MADFHKTIRSNIHDLASKTTNLQLLVKSLLESKILDSSFSEKTDLSESDYNIATDIYTTLLHQEQIDQETFIRCLNENGNEEVATLLNKQNSLPHFWFGIKSPSKHFVGRQPELKLLRSIHKNKQNIANKCAILTGINGIGKTEIALVFAKRFFLKYNGNCALISADQNFVYDSFIQLSKTLELETQELYTNDNIESLKVLIKKVGTNLTNRPCLLIVDNIKNYDDQFFKLLINEYSLLNNMFLLVTSRTEITEPIGIPNAREIKVGPLSLEHTRKYFEEVLNLRDHSSFRTNRNREQVDLEVD